MVAPGGIVTPVNRTPTAWSPPSNTSSRSLLVILMLPVSRSSASSLPSATLISRVPGSSFGLYEITLAAITAVPSAPPPSVTEAVIECAPTESVLMLNDAPAPIVPSRFDVQVRDGVRSPSSKSVAVPEKEIVSPSRKVRPVSGEVIATSGRRFPGSRGMENSYTCPSFSSGLDPLSSHRSTIHKPIWPGSALPGA